MGIIKKGRAQARYAQLSAFSRRSVLPPRAIQRLSSTLGYDAIEVHGAVGRDILAAGLNLLVISTVAMPLTFLFLGLPLHLAVAITVTVSALLAILPRIIDAGSEIRDLFDAAHSFEIFATVLLATGNLALAASKASEVPGKASERFRKAIMSMRDGTPPERAMLRSFSGKGICSEWVKSAVNGREGGISPVVSNWYAELHSRILKSEDMLSLLVALSTILPIGLSMVMAVWGLITTPVSPILILAFSAAITVIFCWFKGLEAILS
ncbi:MAG: hypothetical protein ABC585_04085 [Candidatus Methanosuratincola petrocarbonis]|nr:hypothetical protein [Candidatus Methanosuratincola sp.]